MTHLVDRSRDDGKRQMDRKQRGAWTGGGTQTLGGSKKAKTGIMCLSVRQEKEGVLVFR